MILVLFGIFIGLTIAATYAAYLTKKDKRGSKEAYYAALAQMSKWRDAIHAQQRGMKRQSRKIYRLQNKLEATEHQLNSVKGI